MLEVEVEELPVQLMLVRVVEGAEVVTELQGADMPVMLLAIEEGGEVEVIVTRVLVAVVNEYLSSDTQALADIL